MTGNCWNIFWRCFSLNVCLRLKTANPPSCRLCLIFLPAAALCLSAIKPVCWLPGRWLEIVGAKRIFSEMLQLECLSTNDWKQHPWQSRWTQKSDRAASAMLGMLYSENCDCRSHWFWPKPTLHMIQAMVRPVSEYQYICVAMWCWVRFTNICVPWDVLPL